MTKAYSFGNSWSNSNGLGLTPKACGQPRHGFSAWLYHTFSGTLKNPVFAVGVMYKVLSWPPYCLLFPNNRKCLTKKYLFQKWALYMTSHENGFV